MRPQPESKSEKYVLKSDLSVKHYITVYWWNVCNSAVSQSVNADNHMRVIISSTTIRVRHEIKSHNHPLTTTAKITHLKITTEAKE